MEAVFGDELEVLVACEKIKRNRFYYYQYKEKEL